MERLHGSDLVRGRGLETPYVHELKSGGSAWWSGSVFRTKRKHEAEMRFLGNAFLCKNHCLLFIKIIHHFIAVFHAFVLTNIGTFANFGG